MSCGCGEPNNKHGDDRNITQDDLNQAAQAAKISPDKAAHNIVDSYHQMSGGHGQQAMGRNQGQGPRDQETMR
jgi:hypothetical protein